MAYFKSYRDYNYDGSGKESKSKSSSAASKTFRSYGSYDYDKDLIQARRDQEEEEKRKREEIADRAARKAALIEWEKEKGAREDYGGGIGGLWGRAVDVVSGDTPQDRARRIKQYTDTANLDAKLPDVPKSDKEKGMRASYAGGLAGVWEKAVDIPSGDTPQDRYRRVQDKKKQELDKKRKEEEQQEEILLKAWKKAKLTEVRQQYLKGEIPEEQLNSIVSSITTAYEPAFKADQMYTPDGIAEKAGLVALNIGQYNPVEGLGEIADFASTLTDDTPLRFTQKLLDPISKLQTFGDTRGTVADPSRMGRGWREAAEIAQQLGLMANMSAPLPTGKLRLFTSAVRKLGTSGFFSDIATETIEENLDQGKGKGEAVLKGVTNAAVQTAVERVSNKFQLGKTGGVGKITGKAIPGLDKADDLIPKRLMGMFAGALAEGGEEAVQQLSDNLLNDRPWDEGLSESAIKAVMYGGIIQTGLQTFDAASNKQQRKAAEKQAELDAQTETTQDKTANQLEYEGLDGEVLEAPAFERQRAEARKQAELDAQLKEARKRGDIKAKKKITEEMGKQQQEGEATKPDTGKQSPTGEFKSERTARQKASIYKNKNYKNIKETEDGNIEYINAAGTKSVFRPKLTDEINAKVDAVDNYINSIKEGQTVKTKKYGDIEDVKVIRVNKKKDGTISTITVQKNGFNSKYDPGDLAYEGIRVNDIKSLQRSIGLNYAELDKYQKQDIENILKTDEDGAAAGEKVSIKYPEAKDLPEDVRETIGDKEKLTKKDLDTLGVWFNKTDMKTIIKSIDGLKKNAQFVVAKDAEGDLALTYKDDNHDMSIKLTALGIQRERLEQAGIKPGMVVDATDLKGKGRAPVIEKDGVNYMVAAPTQDYDRVVNKKTGETLGQVVEKLEGYGWAKADINKYVDAVLNPDKAQQKKKQRKGKLSDLNPTKGVFVEYTPWIRAKMPLADNITTVDKTTGGSPDDMITVYRGVPKGKQTEIVAGDFVSTLPELAKSYSGDGVVISKEVRKGDVLDDAESYTMGEETIYRPGADKEILQAQGVLTKAEVKVLRDYTDLITGELESGNTGKDAVILDIRDENALRKQAKNIFAKYNAPFNTQRSRDNIEVAAQLMERSKGTIKEVEQTVEQRPVERSKERANFMAMRQKIKLEPVRTPEEMKFIVDQLNKAGAKAAILRQGGLRSKKALGLWRGAPKGRQGTPSHKEEILKLQDAVIKNPSQYMTTLSHELSHAIEYSVIGNNRETYKLFGDVTKEERQQLQTELEAIVDNWEGADVASSDPKYYYKPTEMLARYVETRLVEPSTAEQIAPLVTQRFNAAAVRHPMINDLIEAMEGNIDKKHVNKIPHFWRDLRQVYTEILGKTAGEQAYNAEVIRRAELQRSEVAVKKLLKTKFKGIKDDPATLMRAMEAVKITKNGQPEFGTHDFATVGVNDEVEQLTLEAEGWESTGWDVRDGEEVLVYSKVRYTPQQANDIFNSLTPEGQDLVRDFTAAKEEAKDEFNREVLKDMYKIEGQLEGWVHRGLREKEKRGGMGRKDSLRKRTAGTRRHRTGEEGWVEDFQKQMEKSLLELESERINNEFIKKQLARISKPIAKGEAPDGGWVEIIADEKGGLRLPGEGNKILIQGEDGKTILVPQKRYQVPRALAEHYREIRDLPKEINKVAKTLNQLGKYWTVNVLLHPGTTGTNFISGGVQYTTKILDGFYADLLTFSPSFPRTRHNLAAPIKVLTPRGWSNAPDWLYGGYRSTYLGQLADSRADTAIEKYGNYGLKGFSLVETYWKKVIAISEGVELDTPASLKKLTEMEKEIIAQVNKEIDLYAFDYDNKPLWMKHFDRKGGKLIKPFATYPYKYSKLIARYATAAFDRSLPVEDRIAKTLTLATIVMAINALYDRQEEEKETPEGTEKTPYQLRAGGRAYVTTDEQGREIFVRTAKYPWFNLTSLGRSAVKGNYQETTDILREQFGTTGIGLDMALLAIGQKSEFDQYKPTDAIIAENVATLIPGFRILNDWGKLIDPVSRTPDNFIQGIGSTLPIYGSEDTRRKLRGEKRTIDIPSEPATRSITDKSTAYTRDVERMWQDTLRSLLTGVYVSRIDPEEAKAQELRELRNAAETQIRELMKKHQFADAMKLASEYGMTIPEASRAYYVREYNTDGTKKE